MKHTFRYSAFSAFLISAAFFSCLCLSGCSLRNLAREYIPGQEGLSPTPAKERVYMDELSGIVQHFDGTSLTILTDDQKSCSLNLARAAIETRDGIVSGDQVHIIYEGQLSSAEDTSGITPLKVVDSIHEEAPLPEQTYTGSLVHLTDHSVTLRGNDQKEITFPVTGADLYFSGGVRQDIPVYIHYRGEIIDMPDDSGPDAGHLKVLTVSDAEPFAPPSAAATPTPSYMKSGSNTAAEESSTSNASYAYLSELNDGIMMVITQSGSALSALDLSAASLYARGGLAHNVLLTIKAYSSLENSESSVGVQSVVCEDIAGYSGKIPSSTVTGVIVGSTKNTVTILTADSVRLTFNREDARDSSTARMENGDYIVITFDPASSGESNLLKAVKIEDP